MPSSKGSQVPSLPTVKVSARGADRLKGGHVWVYRSDIVSSDGIAPGALVTVADPRGKPLGTALYSTASQIAIRLLSPHPVPDFPALVRQRVREAIAYRQLVVRDSDAYRLVFSEADALPGLIVDRYNDIISLQVLTQGMDSESARRAVIAELTEEIKPASIVERVEPRVRELEKLPPRSYTLLAGDNTHTVYTMNGIQFHYSALEGQKTGSFLDQRENYAAAAEYAHGDALDVFCYQGGFALHLATRCPHVMGVDSSRPVLEVADRNGALNQREIEWIEANAFDLLRDYATSGRQYDTIVLDPPAFAKSKQNLETALRGYKELNLRALKMLRPGGVLVTCSCSYHLSLATFIEILSSAAVDSHRSVRILEARGQSKDHPVLPTIPETSYLKAILSYVR
jgi:23S rRNA (cytosine1962-C5)-methyltransferase